MTVQPRPAGWVEYGRAADTTEVVLTRAADTNGGSHLTGLSASFDTTDSALLELFGLKKTEFDASDTAVVDLTNEWFNITDHGLDEDEAVVYHNGGGTSITGLTSGTTYFIIKTSADRFQLEATLGGGAIALSGTQANFGTETMLLPLNAAWQVYDHIELDWSAATTRLGVLLTTSAGGSLGSLVGGLLEHIVKALGEEPTPPPTTQPFPWEKK